MPQSPKELGRVAEEADEDHARAELEDTGIRDKDTSKLASSCKKPPPGVPITATSQLPISSDDSLGFETTEDHDVQERSIDGTPPLVPEPASSRQVHFTTTNPSPDVPQPFKASASGHHSCSLPFSRRAVGSPSCSILCEEEESIFPMRKWTKPLSNMGDASNWKLGVLQTFNSIQY